jgi:oligoendopeptidase F
MRYLTKKQVLQDFRENILPLLDKQYGKDDSIARREEWNNYTDSLCKDRQISNHQYDNWTNPF